jgi:hypothetical protein
VLFTPEGVIFLIVLADALLTKRFPLESNTIVSGTSEARERALSENDVIRGRKFEDGALLQRPDKQVRLRERRAREAGHC